MSSGSPLRQASKDGAASRLLRARISSLTLPRRIDALQRQRSQRVERRFGDAADQLLERQVLACAPGHSIRFASRMASGERSGSASHLEQAEQAAHDRGDLVAQVLLGGVERHARSATSDWSTLSGTPALEPGV